MKGKYNLTYYRKEGSVNTELSQSSTVVYGTMPSIKIVQWQAKGGYQLPDTSVRGGVSSCSLEDQLAL